MARISTIYDKVDGVNQKVFMVRGDEAYAKTTKVEIAYNGGIRRHIGSYDVQIVVDVLRDVNDSTLTFFDGDDDIQVTNWSATDSDRTIWLNGLTYDILHEISVQYDGNSSCLKSKSNTVSINEINTLAYETALTSSSEDAVFDSNQDVILNFNLEDISGHHTSVEGRTISVYVGDILIESSETIDSSGNVSINCGRLTVGKKEIYATFDGYVDPNEQYLLSASDIRFGISIGKIVTLESYPTMFVNGQSNQVVVSVKDYWDNPIEDAVVVFADSSAQTDETGMVTLTPTSMTNGQTYYARCGVYTSNSIIANVMSVSNINMSPSSYITGSGRKAVISVSLEGENVRQANIPITMSGGINGTYYTDNTGSISATYAGAGVGDVRISASCLNISSSIVVEDVLQYWNDSSSINIMEYDDGLVKQVTKASEGWYLGKDSTSPYTYIAFLNNADALTLEFTILSDNSTEIIFGEMPFSLNYQDPLEVQSVFRKLTVSHTKYPRGTKIKIQKVSKFQTRFYVNGNLIEDKSSFNGITEYCCFIRFANNSSVKVQINNLKMKK